MIIHNNYYENSIEKPWGSEFIVETNPYYTLKKLFMKEGCRCSLQLHKKKKETIYVLEGELIIHYRQTYDMKKVLLHEGNSITIEPSVVHRMEGKTDCWYLEASTSELDDVVRLEDDYNRT